MLISHTQATGNVWKHDPEKIQEKGYLFNRYLLFKTLKMPRWEGQDLFCQELYTQRYNLEVYTETFRYIYIYMMYSQ